MNPKLGDLIEFICRKDIIKAQGYIPKVQSGFVDELGTDLLGDYFSTASCGKQHMDKTFLVSVKTIKGLKEWLSTDE